jgi:hypothetical protein
MVDSDPNDHTAHSAQPQHAPAAPLIAEKLAEMVRKLRLARAEVHTLPNSAARLYGDAADALEALTAENARLHARLEDDRAYQIIDGKRVVIRVEPGSIPDGIACRDETIHQQDKMIDDLRDERDRLKAEVERLTAYSRHQYSLGHEAAAVEIGGEVDVLKAELLFAKTRLKHAPSPDHFDIVCEALAEIKATIDGEGLPGQTVADIVDGCLAEIAALPKSKGDLPHPGWYAAHRLRVEAAHAAKETAR